jgi:acyl transferase domain-containing protein/acyl carrier protein
VVERPANGSASGPAALESWIVAELSARLGIPANALDRRERFNRFGLDSMKAAAFTAGLSRHLNVPLPPTLVWDHPSVERLVAHLSGGSGTAPAPPQATRTNVLQTSRATSRIEPIAIVGLACRLPLAGDPLAYWRLLASGFDAIREVPRDRWNIDTLFDADLAAPGKMNTRWGGFLDRIDAFDAEAFGISPREAVQMDPQQRLMLELCSEALDDAGFPRERLRGSATGVFVGAMWSDYARLLAGSLAGITQHTATGQDTSIIAARVSYMYGLQGPSLTVNTACSSSLVSVHLACQSLRTGESSIALAGGVSVIASPESTIAMSKFGAMAPDGRSKAFDARANGYVRGEGGGVVVLKPLSRALADGDRIYCVIAGSATNNDGFSNGLTAPNPAAQEDVLRLAYGRAGIGFDEVQYVETHGTGTLLGDPIEAGALGAVLGTARGADRPLVIGSVKTNIGHLEAAAGVAGLIKVALAVQHRRLPPSLHFDRPNPHVDFERLNLRVQTTLGSWPRPEQPVVAGVSSFGFGGTNAHVIVRELQSSQARTLPLSACDREALRTVAGELRASMVADRHPDVDDLCHTAAALAQQPHRVAFTFSSREELIGQLDSFLDDQPAVGVVSGIAAPRRVAFVCSGQGSQWQGMERECLRSQPVFRTSIRKTAAAIREVAGWDLFDELNAEGADSRLGDVDIVQPVVFAMQVALAAQWRAWGIEPSTIVGHSMGEVAAAHIAGILSLEDATRVICHCSRLLKRIAGRGGMAVVGLSRDEAAARIADRADRIWIAAINSPRSTVLAGDATALHELLALLEANRIFARSIKVDVASQSPQVEPLRRDLSEALQGINPRPGSVPMLSAVTNSVLGSQHLGRSYWVRNLREPVQFESVVAQLADTGHDVFLELTPHPIVNEAIEETLKHHGRTGWALPTFRRDEDNRRVQLQSAAAMWALGVPVDWIRALTGQTLPVSESIAAVAMPTPDRADAAQVHQIVVLSSHTREALVDRARSVAQHLRDRRDLPLEDVSYTTNCRRSHLDHRLAVVANSCRGLADALEAWAAGEEPDGTSSGRSVTGDRKRIVGVFSGYGAQWWGMGRELVQREPVFRAVIDECDRLLRQYVDWSLVEAVRAVDGESRLDRADVGEVALFALQAGLAALWRSWGVKFDAVVGDGLGELAAAQVAGVLSLADAVRVAFHRGRFSQRFAESPEALASTADDEIARSLEGIACQAAAIPIVSAVHGRAAEGWELDEWYWARNMRGCESFLPALAGLIADGFDTFLEVNVDPIAAGTVAACAADLNRPASVLATLSCDLSERRAMLGTLGSLFTAGFELEWGRVHPDGGQVVPLPPYPWQRERFWLETAQTSDAGPRPGCGASISDDVDDWIYDVIWETPTTVDPPTRCAQNDVLAGEPTHWIVFADSSGVADGVVREIAARGGGCTVVRPGAALERRVVDGVVEYRIEVTDPAHYVRVFEQCDGAHTAVVLQFWPLEATVAGGDSPAGAQQAAVGACDAIARVTAAVAASGRPSRLWVVTRGAQPLPGDDVVDPVQATVWGLGRVIALEQPALWGGLLDLDPGDTGPDPEAILGQVLAHDDEDQVAFRHGRRSVPRLVRSAGLVARRLPPLDGNATYLVTGGGGKLGMQAARLLVARGARHLVLVSRSGRVDAASLGALQVAGATVRVAAVDVADTASMSRVFEPFGGTEPPLKGIVHAAGTSALRSVVDADRVTFESVMSAKIAGTLVLHQLSAPLDLDFFVMFSSAASIWGGRGRGAYAAANHFLDAFAHRRRNVDLPALSVDWGPWDEVGVADAAEQAYWDRIGLGAMRSAEALDVLERLMTANLAQRTVGRVDWERFTALQETRRVRPFLQRLRPVPIQAVPAAPTNGSRDLRARIARATGAERLDVLTGLVRDEVRRVLGLEGKPEKDISRGFADMGMDSLMAVDLRKRLERAIGENLPPTVVFNYPTVVTLGRFLAQRFNSQPAAVPAAVALPTFDATAVEDMTEEDAEALLASRVAALSRDVV